MRRITPLPILTLLRLLRSNGGISPSKALHLLPWLLKFVLFEPLRLAEVLRFRKKIERHRISKPPVFILGYYRSGTTYLQRLFIQDKQFGYQTIFHSALPELILGFEWVLKPVLSGITGLFGVENKFHKVPFSWDFPGEEDVAMISSGQEVAANWGHVFPPKLREYMDRYAHFRTDRATIERWKQEYSFWVKKLSLTAGGRRLVLKSPPNSARIRVLLELFPDAKFVCIQRDPYDVFASGRSFWDIVNRYHALQAIDAREIDAMILDSFRSIMDHYQTDKGLIPEGNLVEISYERLAQQPAAVLQGIYHSLALGGYSAAAPQIDRFISKHSDYRQVAYRLTSAEKAMIDASLGAHIDHWQRLHSKTSLKSVL